MRTKQRRRVEKARERPALPPDRVVSQATAAKAIGVSPRVLAKAVRGGGLTALPGPGKTRRFETNELWRWLRAGRPTGGAA